jgi:cytochrome c biogenesis protein
MKVLQGLASTRLTLVGMVLLAIGAGLSYGNPVTTSVWVLVAPLGFLALNLFAAILMQPGINRRGGLLLFHIGLLSLSILVAIGRLTFYEAHVELVAGEPFESTSVSDVHQGPWHRSGLDEVRFVQGPYTVEYGSQLKRGSTRSQVAIADGRGGWSEQVVGDDTPLLINGYRLYTSFNKGFAPVLTWTPDNGEAVTGTVHMPAYPLFDYKQDNRWTPPGSTEIRFWLRLDTGYTLNQPWVLDGRKASGVLVVNSGEQRLELQPGDEVQLTGGRLRYESLNSWIGYKIFYDPTLKWLFIAAILAVAGLARHYWSKFSDQPLAATDEAVKTS